MAAGALENEHGGFVLNRAGYGKQGHAIIGFVLLSCLSFLTLARGATFPPRAQPQSPPRPPKLVRGPYLQLGTPTSVIIRWRTEEPSSSVVRYGPAPGVARFAEVAAGATRDHVVLLSGLAPNTRYFYAIGTTNWILSA